MRLSPPTYAVTAFVTLVIATVAAFFVTQHLKVTTPFIQGKPAPVPNTINPVYGGVCPRRNGKGMLVPTSYKRMKISFYLQNSSDNVDVWIVDRNGERIRQIGSNVFMRARPPKRAHFSWNGRLANGSVAPAGVYYIRVYLVHQGRSLIISNNTAALPVTVQTSRPQVQVTSVTPATITTGGATPVTIRYTGTGALRPRIVIYRLTGDTERPVKNYAATTRAGSSTWDGTLRGARPAPPGTYLIAVRLTDKACTTGTSPSTPPAAPHALVTVS
ncbi:MAG: FlgD immunoglobulin-like domain containing protein [Solirubrobacteraceae bacterium]